LLQVILDLCQEQLALQDAQEMLLQLAKQKNLFKKLEHLFKKLEQKQ